VLLLLLQRVHRLFCIQANLAFLLFLSRTGPG
jgi:hypothetical protein